MEQSRKRKERQEGVTLVEIMAVLIIMALMALGAGAVVVKRVNEAKKNFTRSQIRIISDSITTYKLEKDSYPEDLNSLVPDYIDNTEKIKDGWKKEFYYAVPGDNGAFDLISGGPDGSLDTIDDNINSWELGKTDG